MTHDPHEPDARAFFDKMRDALGPFGSNRIFAFVQRGKLALRFGPMSLEAADYLVQYGEREGIPVTLSADLGEQTDYPRIEALFPPEDRDKRLAAKAELEATHAQFAGIKPAHSIALILSTALILREWIGGPMRPEKRKQWLAALDERLAAFDPEKAATLEPPLSEVAPHPEGHRLGCAVLIQACDAECDCGAWEKQNAERDAAHVRQLGDAIRWALGEGPDPFPPTPTPQPGELTQRYWFREELRRRAFGPDRPGHKRELLDANP